MKRRAVLTMLAAAGLSGCGAFGKTPVRSPEDGFIVRGTVPVRSQDATEFFVDGDTVFVSGMVNADTPTGFGAVRDANPNLKQLVMLDVKGPSGTAESIAFGSAIRTAGLTTHLRNDSSISGAGVDAFLGGTRRSLEDGAVIKAVKGDNPDAHKIFVRQMTGGDAYARFADQYGNKRRGQVMTIAEIGAMGLISGTAREVMAQEG